MEIGIYTLYNLNNLHHPYTYSVVALSLVMTKLGI